MSVRIGHIKLDAIGHFSQGLNHRNVATVKQVVKLLDLRDRERNIDVFVASLIFPFCGTGWSLLQVNGIAVACDPGIELLVAELHTKAQRSGIERDGPVEIGNEQQRAHALQCELR